MKSNAFMEVIGSVCVPLCHALHGYSTKTSPCIPPENTQHTTDDYFSRPCPVHPVLSILLTFTSFQSLSLIPTLACPTSSVPSKTAVIYRGVLGLETALLNADVLTARVGVCPDLHELKIDGCNGHMPDIYTTAQVQAAKHAKSSCPIPKSTPFSRPG